MYQKCVFFFKRPADLEKTYLYGGNRNMINSREAVIRHHWIDSIEAPRYWFRYYISSSLLDCLGLWTRDVPCASWPLWEQSADDRVNEINMEIYIYIFFIKWQLSDFSVRSHYINRHWDRNRHLSYSLMLGDKCVGCERYRVSKL